MTQAISPGNSSGFCGDGDDKNPSAANGQVGNWQTKAQLFDYRQAANPVRSGLTTPIDLYQWDPAIHASGPTSILPLDRSASLGCAGPATSPALAAHFLRILPGEGLKAAADATSSLFYVFRGQGELRHGSKQLSWAEGDLFVLPCGETPILHANEESILYWVHDGPLLTYLGVEPIRARFEPTHYSADLLNKELKALLGHSSSIKSNRLSLLMANADLPATRTVTHTLWAMLGVVPAGAIQPPHRHQSVALDLIIDCDPGCYTLVGSDVDADGTIRNPSRIDWQSGGAFVTPPGLWHAHVNESGRMARLLPIQDSGLHTYLRSLDIRFSGGLVVSD
jgi:gentisate 1,2-dioxygenase